MDDKKQEKPESITDGDYRYYRWVIGSVFACAISHFSGNGVVLNAVHFVLSWFYVVYKFAELFFSNSAV